MPGAQSEVGQNSSSGYSALIVHYFWNAIFRSVLSVALAFLFLCFAICFHIDCLASALMPTDHTVMVGSWIACVDPEGLENIVDEETKNSDVKSLEQYHSNFMVSAHCMHKSWPEHGCMQKS